MKLEHTIVRTNKIGEIDVPDASDAVKEVLENLLPEECINGLNKFFSNTKPDGTIQQRIPNTTIYKEYSPETVQEILETTEQLNKLINTYEKVDLTLKNKEGK